MYSNCDSFLSSKVLTEKKTFATHFISRRLHLLYNKRISPRKTGDKLFFNRIPRKYFQRRWIVSEKWRSTYSQFHTLINVIWSCVLMSHREYKYLLTINIFWKFYCPVLQNALLKVVFFFRDVPYSDVPLVLCACFIFQSYLLVCAVFSIGVLHW